MDDLCCNLDFLGNEFWKLGMKIDRLFLREPERWRSLFVAPSLSCGISLLGLASAFRRELSLADAFHFASSGPHSSLREQLKERTA